MTFPRNCLTEFSEIRYLILDKWQPENLDNPIDTLDDLDDWQDPMNEFRTSKELEDTSTDPEFKGICLTQLHHFWMVDRLLLKS